MNRKKIKKIRKKARGILVEWLQSLVEDEEKKKINEKNLFQMMPQQTHYWFQNQIQLSAWSYKWVIKHLKQNPNLTFKELHETIYKR